MVFEQTECRELVSRERLAGVNGSLAYLVGSERLRLGGLVALGHLDGQGAALGLVVGGRLNFYIGYGRGDRRLVGRKVHNHSPRLFSHLVFRVLLGAVIACVLIIAGIDIGDGGIDGKLDFGRKIAHGIEHLADDGDGLGAQIGKEGDGSNGQHHHQSGRAYEVLQKVHAVQTVSAARVEHQISGERREKLGQRHRAPYHNHRDAGKPLEQAHLIGAHQPQCHHEQEYGDEECGKAEVDGNEPVAEHSSQRPAVIGKLAGKVQPFARAHVVEYALVCLTRVEVGYHGDDHVYHEAEHKQSQDEVDLLVAQYVDEAHGLAH